MQFGRYTLDLTQTQVMGVVNVTPDSFSDGGRFNRLDAALYHAEALIAAGAALLDIGGESTRPGAAALSVAEELDRVIPLLEALNRRFEIPLSIDTRHAVVMREAAAAGAVLLNDVEALQGEGALAVAVQSGLPVCLMHKQGQPATMQQNPHYRDVVAEVAAFLAERMAVAVAAGVQREQILVDPGFGFGKRLEHNLALLAHLPQLQQQLKVPLLVGVSRKSMLGEITGRPVGERLAASVAAASLAAWLGAAIVRVHDVAETVDAVKIMRAVQEYSESCNPIPATGMDSATPLRSAQNDGVKSR